MTTPTMPSEVVDNGDGTYTIPHAVGGDWLIYDTGSGWTASHPQDGWEDARFATAEDVANAILGDPGPCRLWDGRQYTEVFG